MLAFSYFKEVFSIICKNARSSLAEEKKQLLVQRRDLLRNNKMSEYKELVMEMVTKEENLGAEILSDAICHIGFNVLEFMQSHQYYMKNPQTQLILMEAQMGGSDAYSKTPPSISREKAKQIFFDSEEKKFESTKKMMLDSGNQCTDSQEDQMAATMESLVYAAIISDDMFERHGIEEEEFNQAIMYYNLMYDPEVSRRMTESMQKLQMIEGGMEGK